MTRLTRSGSMQSGVRTVVNSANLARQYAITHRTPAEVRFTNSWNGVTVVANGTQIDKWNYLPVGVIIDSNALTSTSLTFRPLEPQQSAATLPSSFGRAIMPAPK